MWVTNRPLQFPPRDDMELIGERARGPVRKMCENSVPRYLLRLFFLPSGDEKQEAVTAAEVERLDRARIPCYRPASETRNLAGSWLRVTVIESQLSCTD